MKKPYVYENCLITHTDATVRQNYTVISTTEFHTGIDLFAEDIFCPFQGVVIQIVSVEEYQSVVIQYSTKISLRWAHLEEVYVSPGELVQSNQKIGKASDFVHFEYLTNQPHIPACRVFIGPIALYKHDPRLVLNHIVVFDQTNSYHRNVSIWGDMYQELSHNRGPR